MKRILFESKGEETLSLSKKAEERFLVRGKMNEEVRMSFDSVSPTSKVQWHWFYLEFSGRGPDHHFVESARDVSEEVHVCLPCSEGCPYCADDRPCFVQEDKYLRLAIISFQALCMLLDFVSMLVVYRFRKAKVNPGTLVMIFLFTVNRPLLRQIELFQILMASLLSRSLSIIRLEYESYIP